MARQIFCAAMLTPFGEGGEGELEFRDLLHGHPAAMHAATVCTVSAEYSPST